MQKLKLPNGALVLGFVACACKTIFKYNSSVGNRHLNDHLRDCTVDRDGQQTIVEFASNPRPQNLTKNDEKVILEAQAKFSAQSLSAFALHDSVAMKNFVQSLLDTSFKYRFSDRPLNAETILSGRKSVKSEILKQSDLVDKRIFQLFIESETQSISCTTDIWSDKFNKDSLIDIEMSYIDNAWNLKTCLLDLIHFPEAHTGEEIKAKLLSSLDEKLNISPKNFIVNFTTDSASNMKKACSQFNWVPCFAHRLHTVVENAVKSARSSNLECEYFFKSVQAVSSHLNFKTNIQKKLPMKITTGPATRSWTSNHNLLNSLLVSYETLTELLPDYMSKINKTILENNLKLFKELEFAFLKFEKQNTPTLYLVIPIYYKLQKIFTLHPNDSEQIGSLKCSFQVSLENKYKSSISMWHYVALFLHPTYKVIFYFYIDSTILRVLALLMIQMQN